MELIADTIAWIVKFPFVVLGWIIVGAVAGELARRFMGSGDHNCIADLLLGVLGAFVGGVRHYLVREVFARHGFQWFYRL